MKGALRRLANTPGALLATVVGSWLAFGVTFAVVEPEVGLGDALYLGTVVQSTLGFGDILPSAAPGKLLVMVYVLFCIYFVLPAMIWHIGQALLEDPDEVTDDDLHRVEAKLDACLAELRVSR